LKDIPLEVIGINKCQSLENIDSIDWKITLFDKNTKETYNQFVCFVEPIIDNTNQILIDYIYDFAQLYGQYYHNKDFDSIIKKVSEKLEIPEVFLEHFVVI
jgi:hypothetical protein